MEKDKYGQEVFLGDWICCVPKGERSVEVGKIVDVSKLGIPLYKTSSKGEKKTIGKTVEYDYATRKEYRKAHFTKIIPTKFLDQQYELS